MATLLSVGVSHREVPIAVRERLAVPADAVAARLAQVRAIRGVREAVLLSTCNRVELFASAEDPLAAAELLAALGGEAASFASVRQGDEALRHLFRVAASLDSLVVGEAQILGQVKEAAALAQSAGTLGPSLSRCFERAISAAKRVRTETALGKGAVSISSIAVQLARKVLGQLAGHSVLLLGAGEMASLAARELMGDGAKEILVANRSAARAEELAAEVSGIPVTLAELPALLERADVVLGSAAVQHPLVTVELLSPALKARRYRPLFFVDLAVPRNIEAAVNGLENVYVYDLDDLEQVAAQNRSLRQGEIARAEAIIEQEWSAALRDAETRASQPVLARLRAQAQQIAQDEAERTLSQLGPLTDKQMKSVRAMGQAIVNKLLHAPTAQLRAEGRAGELSRAAERLFALAEAAQLEADAAAQAEEAEQAPAGPDAAPARGPGARASDLGTGSEG